MISIIKAAGLVLCVGIAGMSATILCYEKINKKGDK